MPTPLFPPLEAPSLFPELRGELRVEPEEARSILRPQRDERYGFGFALSPYRGCSHGCAYCYVREYPHALHDSGDWGRWAAPKINAPELLWNQRHRLSGQRVFLASATDPYQPIEREYRLTRLCLEVLLKCPTTEVLLHTRSPLVLQDVGLLQAFGERLRVGFSIPTDDDTVRQVVEPKAPPIPSRLATVERLAASGIRVSVSVTPLLPVVDPAAFARRIHQSGAQGAWVGSLRLLKQDPFYDLLARHGWLCALDPDYVEGIRQAIGEAFPAAARAWAGRTRSRSKAAGAGPSSPSPVRSLLVLPQHPALFESGVG